MVGNADLLTELGATTDEHGWVVIDPTGRTSVTGVWAAGNAVNPRAQVITAAGEGSAAAIAINQDLVDEEVATAVQTGRGLVTT
jgi:thioredoxin reductase